jgi:hypothetical protein
VLIWVRYSLGRLRKSQYLAHPRLDFASIAKVVLRTHPNGRLRMKRWPYVLLCLVATMLGGCASPSQLAVPAGTAPGASHRTTKSPDLLYVSDVGKNEVFVFSYPQGSLVQTLQGFSSPVRLCSDTAGNVFITNTNARDILKYAHGGSNPIATFRDPGYLPTDCAVDPTTGTLAVTNYGPSGSNTGSIAIYKNGKGQAKILHAPGAQGYLFCTYDTAGNLYVDALNYTYDLLMLELPKGSTKFKKILLNQLLQAWGGVQWDGKYLAISDGSSTVYDFAIKGTKGTKIRTVSLGTAINVVQFWLDGSTLIGPDGPNGAKHDVGLWNYPQGGSPTLRIGDGVLENPSGATVSLGH